MTAKVVSTVAQPNHPTTDPNSDNTTLSENQYQHATFIGRIAFLLNKVWRAKVAKTLFMLQRSQQLKEE